MPEPAVYTLPNFLRAFGIGRTKFYEEVNAGRLRARKNGTRTVVLAVDAQSWLDHLPEFRPKKPGWRKPVSTEGEQPTLRALELTVPADNEKPSVARQNSR